MRQYEKKLDKVIKPYLDKCRASDYNHSLRVVKWVKKLCSKKENLRLLITAAYLHDIGWTNIMPEGKVDLDEMLKLEFKANQNTESLVKKVLYKIKFNKDDVITVLGLIKSADNHESETDEEAIIVDADNLSKLCLDHLEEKYTPESYSKILNLWEVEFPNRIKTEKGKELFPDLLRDLKKRVNKSPSSNG